MSWVKVFRYTQEKVENLYCCGQKQKMRDKHLRHGCYWGLWRSQASTIHN